MAGWIDPKTQRATGFYCLLGVLAAHIYHHGLDQWSLAALLAMTSLGSVSGIVDMLRRASNPPADPPGGKG